MNAFSFRVLVVLPLYGGSLPIGRYCARALRRLGCSVRVFEADVLYGAYAGFKKLDLTPARTNALTNSFLRLVSQAVWSLAEEQKPQIVLALAQAPLDRLTLNKMRQNGMKTVMWFVEDYKVFDYWRLYAPLYDAFAVIQKEPFLSELKKINQKRAFYLPLAADPEFHAPTRLSPREKKEYGSALSFMGAGYPNRRAAFRPLAGKDFKIWGSDWEGESALKDNVQRQGERISEEESVKIYNAADININLHSSLDGERIVGGGDFVNPRTFELAAIGAFQYTDRRALLGELFDDDEIATFNSGEEFYSGLERFLREPEERRRFAEKARERVLREHTYEKRMSFLLEYMAKHFNLTADKSDVAEVESDNPEFRRQLRELREKLGLAPDCAFSDLVARLRQKSGILSPLETSVLFLDEWRKQYGLK